MTKKKTIISSIEHVGILCLISIVTLLTLCSCGGSGEDELQGPQPETNGMGGSDMVAISFSGSEGAETDVTRARTPLSDANVTSFNVWGYKNMDYNDVNGEYGETQKVFPGYNVNWLANSAATTTSNTNGWEYVNQQTSGDEQTVKYWDWNARAYRFFAATEWSGAVSPATIAEYDAYKSYKSSETDEANGPYSICMLANASSATEMEKSPYFSRLWFSTGAPTDYPDKQFGKPVQLEFIQPYARVRFLYRYVYPREGVMLTGQEFKPSNGGKIYRKGAVTITYPLSGAETMESYSVEYAAVGDAAHLAAFTEDYDSEWDTKPYTESDKGWYTVIPNMTQGSYTLTVNLNGAERTAVVPAEYMHWKPGYSYTYIFKITEAGGIDIGWVDYAVTKWNEFTIKYDVYNW